MTDQKITPAEVLHLTPAQVAKMAAAYGDTDKALTARVLALSEALTYGVDVKTIAADMAAEHRRNADIPEVSEQTLGRARFAITVAEMIGTDIRAWAKRDVVAVAGCVKVAKRVGVKRAGAVIREALAPIDKSAHTAREEVAVTAVTSLLAEILPAPEPKAKRSATEPEVAPEGEPEVAPKAGTAAEALAAIRTAVRFLTSPEGDVSADMASAIAELTAAATAARKRGRVALATAKREAAAA